MNNSFFAAFDTSNYTTSFAVCDFDGNVLFNSKRLLGVAGGQRGLRQSDAVFQHTSAMSFVSECISEFNRKYPSGRIAAVGASVRPRDVDGSYMPCFLVGEGVARVSAQLLKVPFYNFSHQAGHVAAALYSSGATELFGEKFAAFHVSGGTTDILLSKGFENGVFDIERIGGTLDLNAGQVIDRVGVYMGLDFPSGPLLEKLALECTEKVPRYVNKIDSLQCNLSGIENKATELYDKTNDKALTAAYTLKAVGDALCQLSKNVIDTFGEIPIVYAGGVMSCSVLKERLAVYSKLFAEPAFSSDNAAGVAYLTRMKFISDMES